MNQRHPQQVDMTLDGEFVSPPAAPVATRILLWAVVVAIIAGALALAAFALWLALLILPVAVGAALVAWAMLRYRIWREQRAQRGVLRP